MDSFSTLGVAILLNSAGKRGKGKVKKEAAAEPGEAGEPTARLRRRRRVRFGVGPGSVSLQGRF